MDVNRKKRQILCVLARSVRAVVEDAGLDFGQVQEIRMRIAKPLIVVYNNQERILPPIQRDREGGHIVTREEMRETLEYVSHYSLYAYEQEIRQGFITIEGGHRVGVIGKAILERDRVKNLQYISGVRHFPLPKNFLKPYFRLIFLSNFPYFYVVCAVCI